MKRTGDWFEVQGDAPDEQRYILGYIASQSNTNDFYNAMSRHYKNVTVTPCATPNIRKKGNKGI